MTSAESSLRHGTILAKSGMIGSPVRMSHYCRI